MGDTTVTYIQPFTPEMQAARLKEAQRIKPNFWVGHQASNLQPRGGRSTADPLAVYADPLRPLERITYPTHPLIPAEDREWLSAHYSLAGGYSYIGPVKGLSRRNKVIDWVFCFNLGHAWLVFMFIFVMSLAVVHFATA